MSRRDNDNIPYSLILTFCIVPRDVVEERIKHLTSVFICEYWHRQIGGHPH